MSDTPPVVRRASAAWGPASAPALWMVLAVLVAGGLSIAFGETLSVGGGFGWDGRVYGVLARDFPAHFDGRAGAPDTYRIQRLLPVAVIHYAMRGLGVSFTEGHLLLAFKVMVVLCLALSAFLWARVARELGLSAGAGWIGFAAVFGGFAIAKRALYYAPLTDVPAFLLGFVLLVAYLRGWRLALFAATLAGAFTWPTLVYVGMLLLCFPRGHRWERPPGRVARDVVAAVPAVLVMAVAGYVHYRARFAWAGAAPVEALVPFGIAWMGVYVFLALRHLVPAAATFGPARFLGWDRAVGVALAAAAFAGSRALIAAHATGQGAMTGLLFPALLVHEGLARPFANIVSHAAYFGPVVLLAVPVWRRACDGMARQGAGLVLACLMGLALGLGTESRQVINFVPFFVPFVIGAVDAAGLTRPLGAVFLVATAVFSKVWLRLNAAFPPGAPAPEFADSGGFPAQIYFGNQGHTMGGPLFLAHLAACLVVLAAFWALLRAPKGPGRAA